MMCPYIRFHSKPKIWFFRQKAICEQPVFTEINGDFEQIFDELRGEKT